jgi:hypothetical protein
MSTPRQVPNEILVGTSQRNGRDGWTKLVFVRYPVAKNDLQDK